MQIIILNGASGSGKTTTAKALYTKLEAIWIHPDELWDTPNMQAEDIFTLAVEKAVQNDSRLISIVDCQIRPTAISPILTKAGIDSWMPVLHHCPNPIREARLLARNWTTSSFPRIANWARVLFEEAHMLRHLVVDTSRESTEQICARIIKKFELEYSCDA